MTSQSPSRRCAVISEIPIHHSRDPSPDGARSRGRLYLGSVQTVFALGNGDNPWNIEAVLSCLPEVNDDINNLIRASHINHHQYFLLDDNDILFSESRCTDQGKITAPCSTTDLDALAASLSSHSDAPPIAAGDDFPAVSSQSLPRMAPATATATRLGHPCENSFDSFECSNFQLLGSLQFIHTCLTNNLNILVHCDGGVLRSPATVVSYLIRFHGLSMSEAKALVTLSRPEVRLRAVEDRLSALEKSLPCMVTVEVPPLDLNREGPDDYRAQTSIPLVPVAAAAAPPTVVFTEPLSSSRSLRSPPRHTMRKKSQDVDGNESLCDWTKDDRHLLSSTMGVSFEDSTRSVASDVVVNPTARSSKPDLSVRIF